MNQQADRENIDIQLLRMIRSRLQQGAQVMIRVNGRSMLPLLKPNDAILLESVQPEQLMPGDIITIVCDGVLLTHRFCGYRFDARHPPLLLTRGDRQLILDPPHTYEQLVGQVVIRQRGHLHLQHGIGYRLNHFINWVFTRTHSIETVLKKDADHFDTPPARHIWGHLIRFGAFRVTTLVTKVVDLLPT